MAARARSLLSKPFAAALVAAARRPSLPRRRPLLAALSELPLLPAAPGAGGPRCLSSRPASSSLNDPSPNWSNRPPKDTILLDGCDFEHWLVVMEKPEGEPARDEIIDSYIKTLAAVVGSEEEARMKIYSVSTRHYFAFGALVSEELSYKLKELPRVRWVLPDSYLHVPTKDYGGEPFINGQAVPYDPKYHEEWVRNNARANERPRRLRNSDRPRNFERRRENMQNRDFQNTTPQRPPFSNAQNGGPASPPAPPMPNAQAAAPRWPGGPSVNQSVPPNGSMPSNGFQNQSVGGTDGLNYQSHGSGVYSNQGVNGVPNAGFHHQEGGYQNQGVPHGAHLNQVGGGYQNQGPGFQNQGLGSGPGNGYQDQGVGNVVPNGGYQNQRNFTNQGNYQGSAPYQNQGIGDTPNSGFQHTYVPNRETGNMANTNANQGRALPGRDAPTMPTRD